MAVQCIRTRQHVFLAGFALALALILGISVYHSAAATAHLTLFGSALAECPQTGATVAAGPPGSAFGSELQAFWNSETVALTITLPDGRVIDPANTDTTLELTELLPGLPPDFPWFSTTSRGGDFYYTFTTENWTPGCYTFTARGLQSQHQATASFVITPPREALTVTGTDAASATVPGSVPNLYGALIVQDRTTGASNGLHGTEVDIFGRSFLAQEVVSIWLTAPDGSVIDYPQQFASDIGSFAATFHFTEVYPTGRYAFTALGTRSGYEAIAYFDLAAQSSLPTGWATLRIADYPADSSLSRSRFELQGKRFQPDERIDIWMTLPDGSVRGLPSQVANSIGEFFTDLTLEEALPAGLYRITARGAASGHLVIADVRLE